MKKLKALVLICTTILFISCSEDDSTTVQITESDLAGTWNLSELSIDGTANISGIPIGIPVEGEGKNLNAKIVVTHQPNNITASGNFVIELTINVPGSAVTQDIPFNLDVLVGDGTWSLNNNGEFIITDNIGSQTFDIKEFDGSILKIRTQEEVPVPYNGTTILVDATVDMTLQK